MQKKSLLLFFTLSLAAVLLLSACAQQPPAATPAPAATSEVDITAEPVTTEASVATDEPAIATPAETVAAETPAEPQGAAESITLTDGLGRSITIPGPAQRVISIAPSNTEILFAIGAGPQVAGREMFSDYPAEAQEVPSVGGGFGELDLETLVSLDSDLILASELTPPEQVQALEDLGLVVFVLPNPVELEGMYENLLITGQLTGHEAEAQALVEDLQARVAAVEEKLAAVSERPLVFYELDSTDPNAPWTAGPGTFIDQLIQRAGGENLGSSLGSDYPQISLEELITQDPDLIILGDYTWGGVTPEDVQARSGWEALSAVQNGRVYTFDDNLVSRPGPRMVNGLEEMAKLLHPELFE